MMFTTLRTFDNKEIVIPNSRLMQSTIINFTAMKTRRLDLTYSVSYSADLLAVKALLMRLCEEEPRIQKDPAPLVAVGEHGASACLLYTSFVGHGGEPVSLLARGFASLGMERWHVGAIAGDPAPEALAVRLRGAGVSRVTLAPLLLRDGFHASRDVFGPPPSWQSSLEAAGLAVSPHRGGLADLAGVRTLFLRRAEEGFAALTPG